MSRILTLFTNLFRLWVLLACALALVRPALFTWFVRQWIPWGLAIIMLGMGLTLKVADFRRVLAMPRTIAVGFAAQYSIMPLLCVPLRHRQFAGGNLAGVSTPREPGSPCGHEKSRPSHLRMTAWESCSGFNQRRRRPRPSDHL